jgi:hypothetical protein
MENTKVVSLLERKYTKMYKEFYSKKRINLSLDAVPLNDGARRFVDNNGIYQVVRLVN